MEVTKVTELKELDNIIPLIKKLKEQTNSEKYVSMMGYLSWITINFPLENFQVWKAEKDGVGKGYLITQITHRYFVPECVIVEALLEENDEEVTARVFDFVVNWAKSKGCQQMAISTKRDNAFAKKYGFEYIGTSMAMKI